MKTLICDCNGTMKLDGPALAAALDKVPGADNEGLTTVHTLLCRREAPAFQRAAKSTGAGEELLVACTQEQRLFLELNDQTEGAPSVQERPIRFVNLRETAGWSRSTATGEPAAAAAVLPKMAALIAAAQRPDPDPVPVVTYKSQGRVLVIGPAARAQAAAQRLQDRLEVELLCTPQPGGRDADGVPQQRQHLVHAGVPTRISGWLGQFEVQWDRANPIDLDLCTRCNACLEVCPEGAIGLDYQIDLSRCSGHRACVQVCEAAGAIDFQRASQSEEGRFDLVLDLREQPAYTQHQWPQGYVHVAPSGGDAALWAAAVQLRELVGEFDKPRFFQYKQKLCAHSRNEKEGCTACIDVCSAKAVRSDASLKGKAGSAGPKVRRPDQQHVVGGQGGGIIVEPFLCVGCGACTTACPTGALSYQTPTAPELGGRIRTMLQAWRAAGGEERPGAPVLLIHSQARGAAFIDELGRQTRLGRRGPDGQMLRGLPARVLPLGVWHTASTGLDIWLSALSWGAAEVVVMLTGEEAPDYRAALQEQVDLARALWQGLGYAGPGVSLLEAAPTAAHAGALPQAAPAFEALVQLDKALTQRVQGLTARKVGASPAFKPATFTVLPEKRATLELCLDHLMAHAPLAATGAAGLPEAIALPGGQRFGSSPLGTLVVDTQACTLCLSCVGACPQGALADNPEKPQLRFVEKNCVQCGLCEKTCPEQAITLQPRWWLADEGKARKQLRVLHEVEPFRCIRCAKPFGTLRAIESMLTKLAGHPAFAGAGADRLKMCGDCRVIDLHTNPNEVRITDL
jgi:ferredoxin